MIALVAAALVLASPPSHVMDQADLIGVASEADLERKLVDFENQHKVEIVVATFDSLMGRSENQVNLQLARDWTIGSRTARRGVLISYWKSDKAVRIDMTDALPQFSGARASEIVSTKMVPRFKEGRSVLALEEGANEVMAFLGANPWSATPIIKRTSGGTKALGGAGSVALVVVFVVLRIMMGSAGLGGGGYRRGWGHRSSSWGGSSWGGGGRSSGGGGGGGGFSGRGASGRW